MKVASMPLLFNYLLIVLECNQLIFVEVMSDQRLIYHLRFIMNCTKPIREMQIYMSCPLDPENAVSNTGPRPNSKHQSERAL